MYKPEGLVTTIKDKWIPVGDGRSYLIGDVVKQEDGSYVAHYNFKGNLIGTTEKGTVFYDRNGDLIGFQESESTSKPNLFAQIAQLYKERIQNLFK